VANLVIGPLTTALFPVAFVTAAVVTVVPWVGSVVGWIPALGATALISIVESLSHAFPTVRTGSSSGMAAGLIAVLCAAVLALLSVDADRWVARISHRRPDLSHRMPVVLLGAAAGVWVAMIAIISLR
jgi:hypothetical protein